MDRTFLIRHLRVNDEGPAGVWRTGALIVLAVLAIGHAAWLAREFLMPVALAVVFAVMASPVVRRLEHAGVPSPMAAASVVFGSLALLLALAWALAPEAFRFAEDLPRMLRRLQSETADLKRAIAPISQATKEVQASVAELGADGGPRTQAVVIEGAGSPLTLAMTTASAFLVQGLFCVVLTYFLLAERRRVKSLTMHAAADNAMRRKIKIMFHDVRTRVSRYLLTVTLINIGLGATVTLALSLFDFPGAALWGVAVGLSNFVPYAGPAVTQLGILLFGVATMGGIGPALLPAAAVWALNTVEGHFVTPWLVGRRVVLNPLAVFLAVAFGGWVWGIAGAIVAVPGLIVVASALEHWWPAITTRGVSRRARHARRRGVRASAASKRAAEAPAAADA